MTIAERIGMNRKELITAPFEKEKEYMEYRIKTGIEENRKDFLTIEVRGKNGNVLPGVQVELEQKSHQFMFGANLFLLDENGNDWYECQKLFSECTKVIAYDSNNIVVSITDDASTLWPIGLSVAEVDSLPEDVDINGGWVFRDNSVVKRIYSDTDLQQQAESKKAALLSHAESVIATLERAVKLNMATDEERAKLEAWERYSVLVYRVDTAKPEWPEEPE